jgi:hypothetical protein
MNAFLAAAGPMADIGGAFVGLGVGLAEKERVAREKKRIDEQVRRAKENFKNEQVGQMFLNAKKLQSSQNIQNMLTGRSGMGEQGLQSSYANQQSATPQTNSLLI